MRVALYIRVSTEEQAQKGYSIDDQKERLIAYCKSQGWDDYALYIDDGYTGTNLNRPALSRMVRHIEDNKIDTVIVYKLDRLGRKQLDVLHLLEEVFEKNNVAFKSATEPFDTSTPLGKAILGILAVFAQLERDMIVERTTAGRRQRLSQGLWHGGQVPFGYTWNKEAQQLEIVPEEAYIVREIYRRYLHGQSRSAIAEWAAAHTKARLFDHAIVRDILRRPVYLGKLVNNGTIVDGRHEAIIDSDTWYAVQKEWARRNEGRTPIGEYLLTGLLECGVCGSPIVHVRRKRKRAGKEYLYEFYACKNQHVRPKERSTELPCRLGYQRRRKVEEFVIEQIKETALNPERITSYLERAEEQSLNQAAVHSLQEKLRVIADGLKNLYDAIQCGAVKASAVSGRITNLEEEREAIERQLDEIIEEEPQYRYDTEMQFLVRQVGEAWDYMTLEEQKVMLRRIIKKVVLNKKSDPAIVWNAVD
ncbi:MAG: recombinase family protein [Brevibacillus sp.]|nr:recombinase family protein [Brevibacillus sp.]